MVSVDEFRQYQGHIQNTLDGLNTGIGNLQTEYQRAILNIQNDIAEIKRVVAEESTKSKQQDDKTRADARTDLTNAETAIKDSSAKSSNDFKQTMSEIRMLADATDNKVKEIEAARDSHQQAISLTYKEAFDSYTELTDKTTKLHSATLEIHDKAQNLTTKTDDIIKEVKQSLEAISNRVYVTEEQVRGFDGRRRET